MEVLYNFLTSLLFALGLVVGGSVFTLFLLVVLRCFFRRNEFFEDFLIRHDPRRHGDKPVVKGDEDWMI